MIVSIEFYALYIISYDYVWVVDAQFDTLSYKNGSFSFANGCKSTFKYLPKYGHGAFKAFVKIFRRWSFNKVLKSLSAAALKVEGALRQGREKLCIRANFFVKDSIMKSSMEASIVEGCSLNFISICLFHIVPLNI